MAKSDKQAQQHDHQRFEVRTTCAECGAELGKQIFNKADLEQQQVMELPDREAMTTVGLPLWVPV